MPTLDGCRHSLQPDIVFTGLRACHISMAGDWALCGVAVNLI